MSRKLKPTYDYIPFKIINIKYYNCILLNLTDGSQVLRGVDDIKKIELSNKDNNLFSEIPDEIFKMLNIITHENIIELFSKKQNEIPKKIEPQTRMEIEKEKEKDLLLNKLLDLEEDELVQKVVLFE